MVSKKGKLPRFITIFSKTYKIIYCRKLETVDPDNKNYKKHANSEQKIIYGNIDFKKGEIRLFNGKDHPLEKLCHYFLHEVLHGIEYELNIDFPNDDPEKVVDTLATGLLHFMVENDIYINRMLR